MAITEKAFADSAALINVEPAVIKAIAEVESAGSGFVAGIPKILYEGHIFYRQLKVRGIDADKVAAHPNSRHLCFPNWKQRPYAVGNAANHARLQQASLISRDAAICACSWGKFQIMAFNWSLCGVPSLQAFVNAMYKDEDEHLRLFINFCINRGLVDEMQKKDWASFALQYNGKGYKANKYDTKMKAAYLKHSK